ncbi:Signal transduction histidine kinase [Streptomyces aidingensis]|uniref:histidine kinase n=2 Tax=Streptomyces aidingensis TaxID=910347 RepID=A0A1I1F1V5_9ACTN|nr:sensor histidine kinase [Streptomyces aidingensis]SFB93314.1 Signal transduction histidine kinase [Streptomyces aidingensis]
MAAALSRRPEFPVAAASLPALAASAEVLLRLDGRMPPAPALALALCTTAPVAVLARPAGNRERPAALAAVTVAAAGLLSLAPFQVLTVAGFGALLFCLHRAGRWGPRRLALLLPLPFAGYALAAPPGPDAASRLVPVVVAVCAAAAAGAGLSRRARATALEHSATERAIADTLAEHAARGERARIARELHDVVAHHVSMIAVQAETARLTTPDLPPAGAERFLAIGDTARTALTEMRRLLGVLREDTGEGEPAARAARRPQPGLDRLGELVDEARDVSGATTRLILRGRRRPLDPGVELTAYRVVQEALTNARRHAPGAAVDVELRWTDDALRLRIRDNGPGAVPAPRSGGGHGLLGMRERIGMAGGELRSGPARSGGFLIEAVFPAPPPAPARSASPSPSSSPSSPPGSGTGTAAREHAG